MVLLIVLFTRYETICGLPLSAASLSRRIACQDVCVQESHAGYLSVIANEPRLHRKKNTVVQWKSRKLVLPTKTYACTYLNWNGNRNTDLIVLLPRARKCGIVKLFVVDFFKKHTLAECQRSGLLQWVRY